MSDNWKRKQVGKAAQPHTWKARTVLAIVETLIIRFSLLIFNYSTIMITCCFSLLLIISDVTEEDNNQSKSRMLRERKITCWVQINMKENLRHIRFLNSNNNSHSYSYSYFPIYNNKLRKSLIPHWQPQSGLATTYTGLERAAVGRTAATHERSSHRSRTAHWPRPPLGCSWKLFVYFF